MNIHRSIAIEWPPFTGDLNCRRQIAFGDRFDMAIHVVAVQWTRFIPGKERLSITMESGEAIDWIPVYGDRDGDRRNI